MIINCSNSKCQQDKCEFYTQCYSYFNKAISTSKKQFSSKLSIINSHDYQKLLVDPVIFSANFKCMVLSRILQRFNLHDFTNEYKTDIIQVRNKFAHAVLCKDDNGCNFFQDKHDKKIIFDNNYCKNIRANIKKYQTLLDEARAKILELR